ncbi:MAG: ATP-binding protein, partial [Anaerolineales bacterium]|nr:ATP-binding protein [Anaerolineales bacterium]
QDGLAGALQKRLDAVENRAGLKARLLVERDVGLLPEVEQVLYRIALEALNNALKHANATSVTIQILFDREWVELSVTDNGRGFDPAAEAKTGGMGLVAMQERVSGLGGDLIIRSSVGEGTCIQARIKLEQSGQQIPLVELVE